MEEEEKKETLTNEQNENIEVLEENEPILKEQCGTDGVGEQLSEPVETNEYPVELNTCEDAVLTNSEVVSSFEPSETTRTEIGERYQVKDEKQMPVESGGHVEEPKPVETAISDTGEYTPKEEVKVGKDVPTSNVTEGYNATTGELQDLDYWELEDEEVISTVVDFEPAKEKSPIVEEPTSAARSDSQSFAVDTQDDQKETQNMVLQSVSEFENNQEDYTKIDANDKSKEDVPVERDSQVVMKTNTLSTADMVFTSTKIMDDENNVVDVQHTGDLMFSSGLEKDKEELESMETAYGTSVEDKQKDLQEAHMQVEQSQRNAEENKETNWTGFLEEDKQLDANNRNASQSTANASMMDSALHHNNNTDSFSNNSIQQKNDSEKSKNPQEVSTHIASDMKKEEGGETQDIFESRARLHLLGDSQYKEKGWGHVRLQQMRKDSPPNLVFFVESETDIFESQVDIDTKFQRVRSKSVRISGSREKDNTDFVLQLPDTQTADEFVECLTHATDQQMKATHSKDNVDSSVNISEEEREKLAELKKKEKDSLAEKHAEMERMRRHIEELEKKKALVRQSLQKRAKTTSQSSSPTSSTPMTEANWMKTLALASAGNDTVSTNSKGSILETFMQSEQNNRISSTVVDNERSPEKGEGNEQIPKTDTNVYLNTNVSVSILQAETREENTTTTCHDTIDNRIEEDKMETNETFPTTLSLSVASEKDNVPFSKGPIQSVDVERISTFIQQSQEEMNDIKKKLQYMQDDIQGRLQIPELNSSYVKQDELQKTIEKIIQALTMEAESYISVLLSEIGGLAKFLAKKEDDNNAQSSSVCRPWSFEDFLSRLHTFRPSTWPAKPETIDAVECARRGWRNVGFNLLECEGKFIYFDENSKNFTEEVERVRKLVTAKGYRFLSPWIGNPCPETFRQVPWYYVSNTVERAKDLMELKLGLQLDGTCIEMVQTELQIYGAPTFEDILHYYEAVDEGAKSSILLSIFGWKAENISTYRKYMEPYEACLSCEYCDIHIVLESSVTNGKFHAEKEHRSFCAFYRGGWRQIIQFLRQLIVANKKGEYSETKMISHHGKRAREDDEEETEQVSLFDSSGKDMQVESTT